MLFVLPVVAIPYAKINVHLLECKNVTNDRKFLLIWSERTMPIFLSEVPILDGISICGQSPTVHIIIDVVRRILSGCCTHILLTASVLISNGMIMIIFMGLVLRFLLGRHDSPSTTGCPFSSSVLRTRHENATLPNTAKITKTHTPGTAGSQGVAFVLTTTAAAVALCNRFCCGSIANTDRVSGL